MKRLSSPANYGKSGGQEVATNEPLTLVAIQAITQGSQPLPLHRPDSGSAQAEQSENWKSVGDLAALIARRAAEKAAGK